MLVQVAAAAAAAVAMAAAAAAAAAVAVAAVAAATTARATPQRRLTTERSTSCWAREREPRCPGTLTEQTRSVTISKEWESPSTIRAEHGTLAAVAAVVDTAVGKAVAVEATPHRAEEGTAEEGTVVEREAAAVDMEADAMPVSLRHGLDTWWIAASLF